MAKRTIAVLLHEKDDTFHTLDYFLHPLLQAWEREGFAIQIARGVRQLGGADVLIPHIDLTVLPEEYVACYDRYPVVINRRLHDISKSRVSSVIVRRGDGYAGPVIVKTNRNSGGIPERYLLPQHGRAKRSLWGMRSRPVAWLERKVRGWRRVETLIEYPVFASLADVPSGVFDNPSLVVEKFLPEVSGRKYCLRHYLAFGDKACNRRVYSNEKIIKGATIVSTEDLPISPALEAWRAGMGLDYGRLDYVVHDGEPIVFDVNRTPAYRPDEAFFAAAVPILVQGLRSRLATAGQNA